MKELWNKFNSIDPREFIEALVYTALIITVATIPLLMMPAYPGETVTPCKSNMKPSVLYISYTAPDVKPLINFKANKEAAKIITDNALSIKARLDSIELPAVQMKLTSLGKYYITGYTSIECGGSTMTASGKTCHKSDYANRITQPTTCAVDPALWSFGSLFYIPAFDTVYVAEDTGSAVKGKHLDLYFWDSEYNYALSITGNYEVFAVEYVEITYQPGDYDIRDAVAKKVTGWKIAGT